jgi:hypothetical protein
MGIQTTVLQIEQLMESMEMTKLNTKSTVDFCLLLLNTK